MTHREPILCPNHTRRGIAMLTVLVILTILAMFATAFVQQVRFQLNTAKQTSNRQIVGDLTSSAADLPRGDFNTILYGSDGVPFTGDEARPYVSLIDQWNIGISGLLSVEDLRSVYDCRRWFLNPLRFYPYDLTTGAIRVHNGGTWDVVQSDGKTLSVNLYISQLGTDEDPTGDFSQDGKPGFSNSDDNLDGVADNAGYSALDDDEDGLTDEDGYDSRTSLLGKVINPFGNVPHIANRVGTMQMNWDKDGDYVGIDPATARININTAGNENLNGLQAYHQGLYTSEIDLESFLVCCLGHSLGLQVAHGYISGGFAGLIKYRQGTDSLPGIHKFDDNGNSPQNASVANNENPKINKLDDDGDGLTDEEDEMPASFNGYDDHNGIKSVGGLSSDLFDNRADRADILTNGKDDDNNGVVDDVFELDYDGLMGPPSIDELAETRPSKPFPDTMSDSGKYDTPFSSREQLGSLLVDGQGNPLLVATGGPTVMEIIGNSITTESSAPRQRKDTNAAPDAYYNRRKLNPNLLMAQTPVGVDTAHPSLADFLSLAALDNDGDWGTNQIRTKNGLNTLVLDDRNKNQLPDGDWDGLAEPNQIDGIDDDRDGLPDDQGDFNKDQLIAYDPEPRINEDPPKFLPVTALDLAIQNELISDPPKQQNRNDRPIQSMPYGNDTFTGDGVDNNGNWARWMSDGIDNDGDGLTDETKLDDYRELRKTMSDPEKAWSYAQDEGIDEMDEYYFESWDDDKDQVRITTVEPFDPTPTPIPIRRMDEDPLDVVFLANLVDSIDMAKSPAEVSSSEDERVDGVTTVSILNASGTTTTAYGNEAIRITEVMARPVMRLQAENASETTATSPNWTLTDIVSSNTTTITSGSHYVALSGSATTARWTFRDIPVGTYYVVVYSLFSKYNLGSAGVTAGISLSNYTSLSPIGTSTAVEIPLFGSQFIDKFDGNRVYYSSAPIAVTNAGELIISISSGGASNISFDYVELYASGAQYVEIANFGEKTINLENWEFRVGAYNDTNSNEAKDTDEVETHRITKIEPASGQSAEDLNLEPGQFAILYSDLSQTPEDITDNGPMGITALKPANHADGVEPLVLGYPSGATQGQVLHLSLHLGEILFGQDGAKRLELYAPNEILVDAFYYTLSSDFCSPGERSRRQDEYAFAPQHRGDPTTSVLRIDMKVDNNNTPADLTDDSTHTYYNYVHGPKRFLAEDAIVTEDLTDAAPNPDEIAKHVGYLRTHIAGKTLAAEIDSGTQDLDDIAIQTWSEFGENIIQSPSGTAQVVTFTWPGLLNWFRNPDAADGKRYPLLFIRAGGLSGYNIGRIDLDPTKDGKSYKQVFHGDLLYVINPNLSDADERYADILDTDTDSFRLSIYGPVASVTGYIPFFSYIEVSPGRVDQIGTASSTGPAGRIAGDPGQEWFYFPDKDLDGQFFYMERRRKVYTDKSTDEVLSFQRSLRFREGPLTSCSPYLAGAGGRNIEKYSMGRGVFSGPSINEIRQIADRIDLHPNPQVDGLINVNCADMKVLCALPFFPPDSELVQDVNTRMTFNAFMGQVVMMGRSERGFDGEVGYPDVDDDGDGQADLNDYGSSPVSSVQFFPHWDSASSGNGNNSRIGYGQFSFNDNEEDSEVTGIVTDEKEEANFPGSDDGPYREVGDMANAMLNPIVISEVRRLNTSNLGSLKPASWKSLDSDVRPTIDESDLHIMLGRIANLSTVQSNEFLVTSRGRIYSIEAATPKVTPVPEQLAEQKIEAEFKR